MFQILLSIPVRIFLKLFCGFKVRGFENLSGVDTTHGLILASNHKHQVDSVMLACALPLASGLGPVNFVALSKGEYERFPIGRYIYGGFLFRLVNGYSIKSGLKDYASTLVKHIELLKLGKTVSIYPEGKIIYTDELGQAHGGVAYLAKVSNAPIIPIAIKGMQLTFGKPIYFDEIDEPSLPEEKRYRAGASKVMSKNGQLIK